MTFVEWYEETYNLQWNENSAILNSLEDEYYTYCHENNLEPIWNG
jgi:hypothetical protein